MIVNKDLVIEYMKKCGYKLCADNVFRSIFSDTENSQWKEITFGQAIALMELDRE